MQRNRTGIVIRQLKSPYKIALLDRSLGRIDGVVRVPVCLGALLHYAVERERATTCFLRDLEIIDLPFSLARLDLLFWHHVLELCYYFVPLGSYTEQLFELLLFLYTVDTGMRWRVQTKKLYLFKLLNIIGLYTRLPQLSMAKLHHFLALPLDKLGNERIDEQSEKILDQWLRVCVAEHPAIRYFETVHFLLPK